VAGFGLKEEKDGEGSKVGRWGLEKGEMGGDEETEGDKEVNREREKKTHIKG